MNEMEQIDLAILGATAIEISSLSDSFPQRERMEIAGNVFTRHTHRDLNLLIGSTGIGKVNAAAVAAAILSRFKVKDLWCVGCAGAFSQTGLRVGDVLITRDAVCGDEGVLHLAGVSSTELIGIPLLQKKGRLFYDRFPLDGFDTFHKLETSLPSGSYVKAGCTGLLAASQSADNAFAIKYGHSLTVGMASGDMETAEKRFQTYAAMAENMEGSALAQVCFLFDVPFLECRGISNMAGVRDKKHWDLNLATDHSHVVIRHVLENIVKI
jgi:futalosine hydrolase